MITDELIADSNSQKDQQDEELVQKGGGNFLNLTISDTSSLISLITFFDNYVETLGSSQKEKIVFLTPFAYQIELLDSTESPAAAVAREFAKR